MQQHMPVTLLCAQGLNLHLPLIKQHSEENKRHNCIPCLVKLICAVIAPAYPNYL